MNAMLDLIRTLMEYAEEHQVPICIEIGNVLFKYEPVPKKDESGAEIVKRIFGEDGSVNLGEQ